MRYQLDLPAAQAIVNQLDPARTVRAIEVPPSGFVNEVRILHTDGPSLVAKIPSAPWKPAKEQRLHAHFRSIGVPAPQVLAFDLGGAILPVPWVLTEHVPGQPWNAIAGDLPDAVTASLYRQLGDLLGRIHGTNFDAFGEPHGPAAALAAGPVDELGGAGPFATWAELHDAFLAERLAYLATTPLADLEPPLRAWFAAHRGRIEGPVTPRLLHMDLHQGNIMVEHGRITGLLDSEEAIIGDRHYDLMRTELAHFRDTPPAWQAAFRAGYEAHLPIGPEHPERHRFYELSRALVWIRSLSAPGRVNLDRPATERQIRAYVLDLLAG